MPDDKTLRCDCGYEVRAATEAEFVDEIRSHAQTAHGIPFTVEEALLVVFRSQLDLSRESFITDMRESRVSPNGGGST